MEERRQFQTADLVVFIGKNLTAAVTLYAIMLYYTVIVSKCFGKR